MRRSFVAMALAVCALTLTPVAAGEAGHLPDLVPLPPMDVQLGAADGEDYFGPKTVIRFTAAYANRSPYPLELLGTPEDVERSRAHQCVQTIAGRCISYEEVGWFVFHAEHLHWHLEPFAIYELRAVRDGAPDYSVPPVQTSGKVSFCLMDSGRDTPPSDLLGLPTYVACTPSIQGISPGWRDEYTFDLWGQQISIVGVPDGIYALTIALDPTGQLRERSTANNTSFGLIELSGGGAEVRALDP